MTEPGSHPFAAACPLIRAGGDTGTGYLVAPDRVATCWHVVKSVPVGGEVEALFEHGTVRAKVLPADEERDAAVLALAEPITAARPLPLGGACQWKAPWDSFGYPGVGGGAGVPLEGIVTRPDGFDDRNRPSIVLRCEELSAGVAAPAGGFSGSPVVVNGVVVGHLKRIIQDKDFRGRPSFGLVWAAPVRAVTDLLGIPAPARDAMRPTRPSLELPAIADDAFHVFVIHADGDAAWATALMARLEGTGLKAFPQRLADRNAAAASPEAALARCRAAIVVLSRHWAGSPGAGDALAAITARAKTDASFRLFPVRLDDTDPPAPLRRDACLTFEDQAGPSGPGLERLLESLAGPGMAPEGASAKAFHAEQGATDELFAEVRAAAAAGPRRIMELWHRWHSAGLPTGPAALHVAQALISQARPQSALEVLDAAGGDGLRAKQLRAHALARRHRTDESIELLVQLREAGAADAETLGLLGGRYKDKWLRSRQAPMLQASFDAYSDAWTRTSDPYVGINTAATALLLQRREEAVGTAGKIVTDLGGRDPAKLTDWDVATLAEALLIVGRFEEARARYRQAVARDPMAVESIAVMRRQARLELAALGHPSNALDDVFAIPRVAAFAGHMTDAPDRPQPRFPRTLVGKVRRALREALASRQVGYGTSSMARGSDLLFLEELIARGGRAQVVLPFPAEAFVATSVGEEWRPRFETLLNDTRIEPEVLAPSAPASGGLPRAFAACNRAVLERTVAFARLLDEEPMLLAVWDGAAGDGAGGTADAVQEWQDEGYDVEVIDIRGLAR